MWILGIFFLVVFLLLCAIDSSSNRARRQRVRELDLSRYDNPAPQKLHVGNVEDDLRRLREQAEEVARRSGARVVSWGEVVTDRNGEQSIVCHMETGDEKEDMERLLAEEERMFGDKIMRNTIIYNEPKEKKKKRRSSRSSTTPGKYPFITLPDLEDAIIEKNLHYLQGKTSPKDVMRPIRAAQDAGVIRRITHQEMNEAFPQYCPLHKSSVIKYTNETSTPYTDQAFKDMVEDFKSLKTQ